LTQPVGSDPIGNVEAVGRRFDRLGLGLPLMNAIDRKAYNALLDDAMSGSPERILEIGGGNGLLALRALMERAPNSVEYCMTEASPRLASYAARRLNAFGRRASVLLATTQLPLPIRGEFDVIMSAFVFDTMTDSEAIQLFERIRGHARPAARLWLLNTHGGSTPLTRCGMGVWRMLHRFHPLLVGGSRPVDFRPLLQASGWSIDKERVVESWGFSSQILGASLAGMRSPTRSSALRADSKM
jgi:hypothetical protein